MALDTRANLLTAIADWLNRTDLTSIIPDFVTLCEAEMKRRLRRTTNVSTVSITGATLTGPTDMAEPINIRLSSSNPGLDVSLNLCTPEMLNDVRARYAAQTGRPTHWAFYNGQLQFAPTPDATYSAVLIYYEQLTPLGEDFTVLAETTATSGSTATPTSAFLVKAAAGWTVDAYNGMEVVLTGGTGSGTRRTIVDTTDTYIEVSEEWDDIPDATTTFKIVDTTSNNVLAEAPDAYLFGALLQAAPYLEHDERIAVWYQKFNDAIDQLNEMRERESYGGGLKEARLSYIF